MALGFTVTHHFAAPPETVFAALTDTAGWAAWLPGYVAVERTDHGPVTVGTGWRETRRMYGKEATEHFEITAHEPPSRIGLRCDGTKGSSGKGEYLFRYALSPADGGTEVILDGEIRGFTGIGALLGRLMVPMFRKACRKDLEALDGHLRTRGG
jgi:uncharacterized protein YndB with AHSA1/START domain